jgi:hypothetical protein
MSFEMFKSGKLHFSQLEVGVLRCLVEKNNRPNSTNLTELSEIIQSTSVRDQDEILRALYTLEGKGLVSPDPEGDFTSSRWKATEHGVGTMSVIEVSLNRGNKAA